MTLYEEILFSFSARADKTNRNRLDYSSVRAVLANKSHTRYIVVGWISFTVG